MDHPPPTAREQMLAIAAQRALYSTQPEVRTMQSMYFKHDSQRKRGPPTPVMSAGTTPQDAPEAPAASSDEPALVAPTVMEAEVAMQTTTGHFGIDVNDHNAVSQFLQRPVQTAEDVLRLVHGYHLKVIRPETFGMILQVEAAIKSMNDRLFTTTQELKFLASENRAQQKHASGMMLVLTGFPQTMPPHDRAYMIGWMLQQVEDVRRYLQNRRLLPEGATTEEISPEFWFQVLAVDPVTVPQAGGHSAMTMITFKSWDVRSSFLRRFGGQSGTPLYHNADTAVAGKHVKVSPCAPQWQRKLEAPLRVVLSAVNAHEDWQGMTLTILWKSLTIMKPSQERDFVPDHTAWARLFYEEKDGVFRGRLEVARELANVLLSPSSAGSGEESLWTEHWNSVIWGNQHTIDQLEKESFQKAKVQGHTAGKGALVGKGKKHWSNAILHSDFYSPYPFELEFVGVDAVAFSWDEYCDKLGKPEEKVGSYSVGTYQGKPPVDHTAQGDVDMGPDPFAEPSAELTPQGLSTAAGKGKGKTKSKAPAPKAAS
ncbi:unnamed protein product [Symbiodinium sp. CCMP2592]|nr:unnamed protein product [Symbiodinium sp. CCMP2592]